ncbi:MAG: family 78 glycoside hydrolase catalytic domain [Clostridia bacterium]|nr:family 78 glycoside hydrolase catalytic domain [Clostridia bacterium]
MKAIRIKTEFLTNPIGVDFQQPLITWNCEGGIKQTAYRIIANSNGTLAWDSGRVESASMRAIYPQKLNSRDRIELSITLWDETDTTGESVESFFEMGLLDKSDWQAKWISGNYTVNPFIRYPVDCFKKEFDTTDIKKARIYATACGIYELVLNGERVGDYVLAPGHTDYRKRVQYQTYDATELLKNGKNVLTAALADGWYRGSCGAWGLKNQYGTRTKLLVQLEIEKNDGTRQVIVTDGSWSWSNDGSIRFADNQDGEIVDARLAPTYFGKAEVTSHKVTPVASNNVPIREKETFKPTVITTPSGKRVLDFGQNIAGYVKFSLDAKTGQAIKMRFGEMFDENGEFTQKNIQCATKNRQTPLQEITYTAKDGLNEYKTKFAIFGFQYVLIEGDIEWNPEDFTAIAVYSDMEDTLSFDCSHELINKLVASTRWSTKNNHADVPTDCPTRERHAWTGDAQIFCNTAAYFFDYAPMARKYVLDMCDGQRKNGVFRQITPVGGIDFYMNAMDGSAGWSDAGVLIPYRIYKRYGDVRILSKNYEAMKKYAKFKIGTIGKHYLTSLPTGLERKYSKMISNYGQSYGEWAEPTDVNAFKISDFINPHPEETTAYLVYMLETMAEIAELLGKEEDKELFLKKANLVRSGYQKLIETPKYSYDTDRQAKLVRPLYLKLLNEKQTEFAKARLLKALDNYGWRLGTGFLSTPFILYVLADMDIEYAYRLLENEEMPGWLFMPKMGANTIWESWEGTEAQGGVASLNHYSKGAVCEWIFGEMCGIKIGGENEYIIEPKIGGSITHASCEYNGVYGKVKSEWKRSDEKIVCRITVPANVTVKAILPNGEHILDCGVYEFAVNK